MHRAKKRKKHFRCIALLLIHSQIAYSVPMIGYGSSDAILTSKTQEAYYLGFELGMTISLGKKNISKYITVENIWDGSSLGAKKSAEKLLQKEIVALVGFPTSHEALLAAGSSQKANTMGVFTSSLHEDLDKMGPLVVSTAPSIRTEVEMFLKFIQAHFPNKRGVLITNPYIVFDKNQADIFHELLTQARFSNVKLKTVTLCKENKMVLSQNEIAQLKVGGIEYFFVGNYADNSVQLLEQLEKTGLDLPLIATASWTSNEFDLIRRMLIRHKSPVYSISHWVKGARSANYFENEFKHQYGIEPTGASAWGFDLGMVVGTTLSRMRPPFSKKQFVDAFYMKPCFAVSSSGEICFKAQGGHAKRKMSFVRFSEAGFIPYEEPQLRSN